MQRDCLSYDLYVSFKAIESGANLIKILLHELFDRRGRAEKTFNRGLDDHALAGARAVRCGLELFKDRFGKLDAESN